MISRAEAERIAQAELDRMEIDFPVALLLGETQEHDFGWVFFYQSVEFIESGKLSSLLLGNAPLIVDRENGKLTVTSTYRPISYFVER